MNDKEKAKFLSRAKYYCQKALDIFARQSTCVEKFHENDTTIAENNTQIVELAEQLALEPDISDRPADNIVKHQKLEQFNNVDTNDEAKTVIHKMTNHYTLLCGTMEHYKHLLQQQFKILNSQYHCLERLRTIRHKNYPQYKTEPNSEAQFTQGNNCKQQKPFYKIILGSFSQYSDAYQEPQNQCVGMAVAAIAAAEEIKIADWTPKDLDNVLDAGDVYYRHCIRQMQSQQTNIGYIDPGKVNYPVTIGFNQYTVVPHDNQSIDRVISKDNLTAAFDKLQTNEMFNVIFTHGFRSYAFLRRVDLYIFFDSHGRNLEGRSVDPNHESQQGKSALMFFDSAEAFIDFYLGQFDKPTAQFNIIPISVQLKTRNSLLPSTPLTTKKMIGGANIQVPRDIIQEQTPVQLRHKKRNIERQQSLAEDYTMSILADHTVPLAINTKVETINASASIPLPTDHDIPQTSLNKFAHQAKLMSEHDFRILADKIFGEICSFNRSDNYVSPVQPAYCKSNKCKMCPLISRNDSTLTALGKHNIYPKAQRSCNEVGCYSYSGPNDEIYSGHTNQSHRSNHNHKIENWKVDDWELWSCVAFPTMGHMLDLLLEDILIMLCNGPRNKCMNIYQKFVNNDDHNKFINFLQRNPDYRQFYVSLPFLQLITKTALPHNYPLSDTSVRDIINEFVPTVRIDDPKEKLFWYKPPVHQHGNSSVGDSYGELYKRIEKNGTKSRFKNEIWKGKIYGMGVIENFEWQFEQFKEHFFVQCNEACTPCKYFNKFIKSDYHKLFIILELNHIKHLGRIIQQQNIPSIRLDLGSNTGDASGTKFRLHNLKCEKTNITPREPTELVRRTADVKQIIALINDRIDIVYSPGCYACNLGGSTSNKDCQTCPQISSTHFQNYFEQFKLQHLDITTCKERGNYLYIHRYQPIVYNGSTQLKMSERNTMRRKYEKIHPHLGKLEFWYNYVIKTTGNIGLDRYIEDAFIVLQTTQHKYQSSNYDLNIYGLQSLPYTQLFNYFDEIDPREKLKLIHLYSTKAFFSFLFSHKSPLDLEKINQHPDRG